MAIIIIEAYQLDDPEKKFDACYLGDDGELFDPLLLYSSPDYDPFDVNPEGLFAFGGEINLNNMFLAYKWGIFPWYSYKQYEEALWYCPRERFVIFPDKIHISHSQRPLLNKRRYHITINKAFEQVIDHCQKVNKRNEHENAWLSDAIKENFIKLYKEGFAKSVEVWEGDKLAGGFYGFFYKGVFEGDSMFSLKPSASQIGLILLCQNPYIEGEKIKLIDTQFETPTFKKLGGEMITYKKFREIMDEPSLFIDSR